MLSFLGTYEYSVDQKGRLSIPSIFRSKTDSPEGEHFVVTPDPRGCLNIYNTETWNPKQAKYDKLDDDDPKVAHYLHKVLDSARHVYTDTMGRITIPQNLLEKARIKKDAVIKGVSKKFEVWDPAVLAEYEKYLDSLADGINLDKTPG